MTRPLQSDSQHPLMSGTRPGLAPWFDLASVGDVSAQPPRLLEVNRLRLVDAKCADSPAAKPATATASRPFRGAPGTGALRRGLNWLFDRFAHVLFSKIKLSLVFLVYSAVWLRLEGHFFRVDFAT